MQQNDRPRGWGRNRRKREIAFLLIWILNPLAILLYQNCTPAEISKIEAKITPVEKQSAQNLSLPQ